MAANDSRPGPRRGPRWRKRQSLLYALHAERTPAESIRLTYSFGLGFVAVLATLVAVGTGVLLSFYYEPTEDGAHASVTLIEDVAAYGSLVRGLHYWSAQVLVVAAALHLARIVLTGAFGRPRRTNWLIGLALFVLMLLWSFSGYALRWDEDALWALLVGTNLFREIPVYGEWLYRLLVGDAQIGAAALLRFYTWHVIGLTLVAGFGIFYHLFRLRRDGGLSRPPLRPGQHRQFVSPETLLYREAIATALMLAALLIISVLWPAPLGSPAQLDQPPAAAQAPWFFLWVQELLRWLPAFWAGIGVPLGLLLLLALIPWLSRTGRVGVWFAPGRAPATTILFVTGAALLGLTLLASLR